MKQDHTNYDRTNCANPCPDRIRETHRQTFDCLWQKVKTSNHANHCVKRIIDFRKPSLHFIIVDQNTSKIPAMINSIHAILTFLLNYKKNTQKRGKSSLQRPNGMIILFILPGGRLYIFFCSIAHLSRYRQSHTF